MYAAAISPLKVDYYRPRLHPLRTRQCDDGNLDGCGCRLGELGLVLRAQGYHVEWVMANNVERIPILFKYIVASSSWYFAIISLAKLSFCVFYRALFPQRSVYIILCITAGIMICTAVVSFVADLAA